MPNNNLEYKSQELKDIGTTTDGSGYIEGYGNTLYDVDKYGDIVIEYKGIDSLIKDGAAYDAHGLNKGEMGDYSFDAQIGMVMSAHVDAKGLFSRIQFYKDQGSQDARSKIQDRIDNGKSVYQSIGWRPDEQLYVYANDYKTVLPQYIPADKLDQVYKQIAPFPKVRLVKAEVNEISIAPRPVNKNSEVLSYKSEANMKVEFTDKNEFKAQLLDETIADTLTLAALDRLYSRQSSMLYNIFFPWNQQPEDEGNEVTNAQALIQQVADIAKQVIAQMQSLELITQEDMKAYVDTDLSFKSKQVSKVSESFVTAFGEFKNKADRFINWRKECIEQEVKAGKRFSAKDEKQTRTIQDSAKSIAQMATDIDKSVDDMLSQMDGSDEQKAFLESMELSLIEHETILF